LKGLYYWAKVPMYIIAQIVGAILDGIIVFMDILLIFIKQLTLLLN